MDITDKQYLLQSLAGLVRDENTRIITSGLATPDETRKLIESVQSTLLSDHLDAGPDTIINALSFVHRNLSAVKLPGDFEKVACGIQDAFCIVLDVPVEEEAAKIDTPQEGVLVIEPKEKDEKKEKAEKVKADIISRLEKIAYGLGQKGEHEAAYAIERTIHEFEAFAANPFDSGEFDAAEKQHAQTPRPTQQQVVEMGAKETPEQFNKRMQQSGVNVYNKPIQPLPAKPAPGQPVPAKPQAGQPVPAKPQAGQPAAKPAGKPPMVNIQWPQGITPQQKQWVVTQNKKNPQRSIKQLIDMVMRQPKK